MSKGLRRTLTAMINDTMVKTQVPLKPALVMMLLAGAVVCLGGGRDELPRCPGCARNGVWREFQRKLAYEVKESGKEYDVVFMGDSITEAYRGTSMGSRECMDYRCRGIPKLFKEEFKSQRKIVLAISGDQVEHVLWRLDHGEKEILPKTKSVVLLIGTNDLSQFISPLVGGWWSPPPNASITHAQSQAGASLVASRIHRLVTRLRSEMRKDAKLVLVGILPRGPSFKNATYEWPNNIYTTAVNFINEELKETYNRQPNTVVVSCGGNFVKDGMIVKGLMEDALHPTDKGSKYLIDCIKGGLREVGAIV